MGFVEWEKKFELGIAEMDLQHRTWLDMLNRFYDQLKDGNLNANMAEMVEEARNYTSYHFAEEEKFMANIGYPGLTAQKAMHNKIKRRIEAFQREIQKGRFVVSTTVTTEMKNWFRDHILLEDKGYGDYYREVSGNR